MLNAVGPFVIPAAMSMPAEPSNQLSPTQERKWFRYWILALGSLFIIAGGISVYFEWQTRRAQSVRHQQLMDPAASDPGVTAAEKTSTDKATQVHVGFYVERIPELSTKDARWTVVFDVWFRWQGDDIKPADNFVVMEGAIEAREKLAEFHADVTHYERYQVTANITTPLSVAQFPLDSHLLLIALENGDIVREKMVFVPDLKNTSVSSRVSVPGYVIADSTTLEKPHSYKTTRGDPRLPPDTKSTYSQIRMGIAIARSGWGLYFKMFQALYIAVIIAALACFIKPTDVDPRFGLGVGALFAAVANSYIVSSFVPDTGELALADVVNGLGILTILVTLIESTVSLYLYDRCGEPELSQRLDRVSFRVVVVGFIAANLALLIAAGGFGGSKF
jgi:hypothetical protein